MGCFQRESKYLALLHPPKSNRVISITRDIWQKEVLEWPKEMNSKKWMKYENILYIKHAYTSIRRTNIPTQAYVVQTYKLSQIEKIKVHMKKERKKASSTWRGQIISSYLSLSQERHGTTHPFIFKNAPGVRRSLWQVKQQLTILNKGLFSWFSRDP